MKYFKVKPESDQTQINERRFLVAEELYTMREMGKDQIPLKHTEEITIPKHKTYFAFGARFHLTNAVETF